MIKRLERIDLRIRRIGRAVRDDGLPGVHLDFRIFHQMIGEIYQAFPAARLRLTEARHRREQGVARLLIPLRIRYAREQEESRAFSFFLCE